MRLDVDLVILVTVLVQKNGGRKKLDSRSLSAYTN